MHRFPIVPITVIALAAAASAAASGRVVELDTPGMLATIERDNPGHSRKIQAILTAAQKLPCQDDEFGRVIRTAFDARDGHCSLALMTSLPAKRVLHFTLDQTHYRATVRVATDGMVMPVTSRTVTMPAAPNAGGRNATPEKASAAPK